MTVNGKEENMQRREILREDGKTRLKQMKGKRMR
jgi:hypothetical protein